MPLQVDTVYENGVPRPLQPLDLKEHEHVLVSAVKAAAQRSNLAVEYIESVKRELQDAEPARGLEFADGLPRIPDQWLPKLLPTEY